MMPLVEPAARASQLSGAPTDPFEHCRRDILRIRIDGSSPVVSCC
jgi:hypothetical protein